ncbi:hypothetical protein LTR70_007180 [Exophiala xenobiotica]|uniref:RING-type domain-containing protein n=1 Tax=Lithohypha guttulata TaxID=1690604 RepID=A0ABR0KFF4_9EURO|nr:hypothetical protein LTR24_003267 [Lithohypha guttulata]KAK5314465.1 hypothetical protein LTR70_007180 [Exophiala xenobiotica]
MEGQSPPAPSPSSDAQSRHEHQQDTPPPQPRADNTTQPTQPLRKTSYWPPPEAFFVGNCDSATCTHGGKAITLADKRFRHGCGAIFHLGYAQRYEGRENPACPSCRESIDNVRSE